MSVTANAIFSDDGSSICQLSPDLFFEFFGINSSLEFDSSKHLFYVCVHLLNYNKFEKSKLIQCRINEALKNNTVELPAKTFCLQNHLPAVDTCKVEPFTEELPVLENVVIALNSELYSQLIQLPNVADQLKFIAMKCDLDDKKTVVHRGDNLWNSWCRVIFCSPHYQGLIDLNQTKIVLLNSEPEKIVNTGYTEIQSISDLHLVRPNRVILKLKGLPFAINPIFLKPQPAELDDDSSFVFANVQTLLKLGVTSGSYVKISCSGIQRVAKIFVLLSPNNFDTLTIYAPPKIMANLKCPKEVEVEKSDMKIRDLPIASSVSVARVGNWENFQRLHQNIIFHNLTFYLTDKRRILCSNDLIPITFDSSMASMYSEDLNEFHLDTKDDCLVWFKVGDVEFDDMPDYKGEFIIDNTKTRLVTTNVISEPPMKTLNCDYVSYFGLPRLFNYNLDKFAFVKRFRDIIKAAIRCYERGIRINTSLLLHSYTPNVGKSTIVRSIAAELGMHLLEIDCVSISVNSGSSDTTSKVIGFIKAKLEHVLPFTEPALIYLAHLDAILEKEDQQQDPSSLKIARSTSIEMSNLIEQYTQNFPGTVFVGSANDIDKVPETVRSKIKFEIEVPVPDEPQRSEIFKYCLSETSLNEGSYVGYKFCVGSDVIFSKLALQSAGLTPLNLKSIVNSAKMNCFKRLSEKNVRKISIFEGGFLPINLEDLRCAINNARDEFSDSIGAPKIPTVSWDDIGGLEMVKGEIMDTIDMPLKHPELFSSGMKKRSGILFYGPPGTGKTLLAKAIATNFSLNFFSVKGPELLNMYIGESEANVRRVFQKARDAKPCVIFFDELDSVAPKRGNQGDSGGVMDRIVSQLLAELDGMSSSGENGDGVFVIGATNRPDLLDEALLRPGRFDKMLYLGISDTDEKQENILKALTRKFTLDKGVNLSQLAEKCPFTYTGADFYALSSDAMLNAMTRIAGEVDEKVNQYNTEHKKNVSVRYWFDKIATERDSEVVVKMQDFTKAQNELIPSVSEEELNHYLQIRANFETS